MSKAYTEVQRTIQLYMEKLIGLTYSVSIQ